MNKLNIIEQHGAGIAGQLLAKIRGVNASDSAPDNWIYIQDGRSKLVAFRFSTIGVPILSRIETIPSGWGLNILFKKTIGCGRSPMTK
ncbi:MAG: hypothetical protein CM1200mP41_38670 [Gammaproteobacteria bacterium]|nr:MAG: hypothetical protein CM1200mP41_38670 [Gammaproteobacteria bacterium]